MKRFVQVNKVSLSESIETELRRRISEGLYKPGSVLPSERKFAREFGTTRVTLGVALQVLVEDGLSDTNIPFDESLVVECRSTDALSAYFAIRPLLEQADGPTAIIAARDTLADGVCRAIGEMGLEVGIDVSIIGFDNHTWPNGRELVTTYNEPCYEMGKSAVQILAAKIVNYEIPEKKIQFKTEFLLRRTAGPLRLKRQHNAALDKARIATIPDKPSKNLPTSHSLQPTELDKG